MNISILISGVTVAKSKIPIWDNLKDCDDKLRGLLEEILILSDKDFQIRVWYRAEGPEMSWYDEFCLNFDYSIEFFKKNLREKKIILSPEQIKAILRVYVMHCHFANLPDPNYSKITDFAERHLYIINHPYWEKIRKKADDALKLLNVLPPEAFN